MRGNQGFSIIQVLIASTAVAGLALVGLRLAEDQKKIALKTSRSFLVGYIKKEISYLLSSEKNCSLTFNGKKPGSDVINSLSQVFVDKATGEISRSSRFNVSTVYNFGKENIFSILSFRLSSEAPYTTEKGYNVLNVEFDLGDGIIGSNIFRAKIPISFTTNEKGQIDKCSVKTKSTVNGPWIIENQSMVPKNKNVGVSVNEAAAQLHVNGDMGIASENFQPCDEKSEGVLAKRGKTIAFCDGGQWRNVGDINLNFKKPESYRLSLLTAGQKERETKFHNYCALNRIKISDPLGSCRFEKIAQTDSKSKYRIQAFSNGKSTMIECEVYCFD
ncbi:MAG: hypothetical protein GY909_02335 [Oligoflexia bacterium]|nr:hypothetical protein [Oligoflexia bacterium]